jgi:2-desacetyl-2-hydroxyethyl bacteriochlorophyllide A dehydrogenase
MTTVPALVCAEPGRLSLEGRPAPEAAPGNAVVRPRRVGICGTDYHIFEGKHPFLQYPRVMGHELAVEVVDTGGRHDIAAGDVCVVNPYVSCGTCHACRLGRPNACMRVSVLGVHRDGGMTGLLALPAANLIPAPGLSVDQCAAVEFLAIGAHAVRRGAVAAQDRVLAVGSGPIGLGVALFARLSGGQVHIYDLDPARATAAQAITGAQPLVAEQGLSDAALAATDGDGFDVVFDATGNRRSMEAGFDAVGHGGRYVLVSVVKEPIAFADPDFHRKEMTLMGSRNATSEDFQRVMQAMRDGNVPMERLVTHRTSLEGAVTDLPRWTHDKTGLIKALIEVG